MEQFKLKSIEEFDTEFAESVGLIQKEIKEEIVPETNIAQETPAENKFEVKIDDSPKPDDTVLPGLDNGNSAPEKKPFKLFEGVDDDDSYDEPKEKGSKGALAGKIVSIVMLVATVVVFVLGCFLAVCLDNHSIAIGGNTFNTMAVDNEKLGVYKGDLVIGKKVAASDYAVGELVAVASTTGEGCDLMQITNVSFLGEEAQLTLADVTGNATYQQPVYSSEDCLGSVDSYIPSIAGFLNFAMANAILVCVLFVLLAALWCLVLVLIEKSNSKKYEMEEIPEGSSEE